MPEPTTPEGAQEPQPSTGTPSTAPEGSAGAPEPEQVPSSSQAAPARGPADPTAPIPPAGPPTQPMPAAQAHAAGVPGPPPARPGMWKQATSTTGGLIAVILACGLAVVLLLGIVGTGLLVATRVAHHDDRGERIGVARGDREDREELPPGLRKKLDDKAPGPRTDGQGRGGMGNGNGNGNGMGMDNGLGPLMRAAMALGNVQHGEFTVTDAAGKATVMVLQRGDVTKVSGTSISVKSADNFAGTYAMDATTAGRAGNVAVGDSVLVVAEKAGSKAVLVAATRRG